MQTLRAHIGTADLFGVGRIAVADVGVGIARDFSYTSIGNVSSIESRAIRGSLTFYGA